MGDLASKITEIGIAIMGYGVVGKGVAHVIRNNSDQIAKRTGLRLRLLHVLDILSFPDSPDAALMTRDVQDIMDDNNVHVIVETMGGIKTAYDYTRDAFMRRKHVVTSNKELVAEFGPELLALASSCGVHYRFDASVGGGIPIVSPLRECLAANSVGEIIGILNGTTNFMLTYMRTSGAGFAETLKMAQDEGFAENDPSADIEGADACRKLAILSSIAWDAFLDWKDIHTEGIEGATPEDAAAAAELGRVLKLVARARRLEDGRVEAYVLPVMLGRDNLLSGVNGVNNAVVVHGDLTGDVMLYGQGAGSLPTGSAIVSDIIKIASGPGGLGAAGGPDGLGAADGPGMLDAADGPGGCEVDAHCADDIVRDINAPGSLGDIYSNPCWNRNTAIGAIDFATYIHGYYARIETPDTDAFCEELFKEFPQARILPRVQLSGAGAGPGDCGHSCAFMVQNLVEGEFLQKLTSVIAKTNGSSIKFTARLI